MALYEIIKVRSLKELIDLLGQQPKAKPEQKMKDDLPKDMGALGNM